MTGRLSFRWRFPLAIILAALVFFAGSSGAQTPQKIIDEYIRAEGGARALARIQSQSIAGSLHVASADDSSQQSGSYSLITKAPNKLYSELIVEPQHVV